MFVWPKYNPIIAARKIENVRPPVKLSTAKIALFAAGIQINIK